MDFRGRVIRAGRAQGPVLYSEQPIGFFGCVNPDTGEITERTHPLAGRSVAGTILVFPRGKGSTVGSYTLYRLKHNELAPAAILNAECEPIIAVGCIISEIPCVDQIEIQSIQDGDWIILKGGQVEISEKPASQ